MVYSISFCFALKRDVCQADQLESSYRRSDSMALEYGRRLKLGHQVDCK